MVFVESQYKSNLRSVGKSLCGNLGTLEHRNPLPRLEVQIVVDGEEHHEVEEEGGSGEEVPDVVIVIKVEQLALVVGKGLQATTTKR